MKIKNLFSVTRNKNNKQLNYSLRVKKLRQLGMTPEELAELTILKTKVKFYKK